MREMGRPGPQVNFQFSVKPEGGLKIDGYDVFENGSSRLCTASAPPEQRHPSAPFSSIPLPPCPYAPRKSAPAGAAGGGGVRCPSG